MGRSWAGGVGTLAIVSVLCVALVSGAVPSPISPVLPPHAGPIPPLRWAARLFGLSSLSGSGKAAAGFVSVFFASGAFLVAVIAAWRGRVSIRAAVAVGITLEALALVMPVLWTHDVFHYAMYGRMISIHHANPYEFSLSRFPGDPFYRYISPEWRHTPSLYGPAFVELSALITGVLRSPAAVVLAFKAISAAAAMSATLLVARLASRLAPGRAAFAVVLFGWNPVVVLYVVSPGHMDAILALFVIGALWTLTPAARSPAQTHQPRPQRELIAVVLLTLATAMKVPLGALLALAVAAIAARRPPGRRLYGAAVATSVAAAVYIAFSLPFLLGSDPTMAMTRLNDYGGYAAPSSLMGVLLGVTTRAVASTSVARVVVRIVRSVFTLGVAAVVVAGIRAMIRGDRASSPTEVGACWAWVLTLVVLMAPIFWPWYFVWLLPIAWMLPTHPRWSVVGISALFPLFVIVAEPRLAPLAYDVTRNASLAVLAPALLLLLILLGTRFFLLVGHELPLEAEA